MKTNQNDSLETALCNDIADAFAYGRTKEETVQKVQEVLSNYPPKLVANFVVSLSVEAGRLISES